ncbi:MAG: class I SAM-dependent methyltransferase, partial [Nitrospinaceae bacterium]|nr:class I SAM-dependent methyltransferase [Nitrospinaceae bacterium]
MPAHAAYDLVISTETFEHFHRPGDEVPRAVGRVAPGGYLAVMTRFPPRPQNGETAQET